MSMQLIKMFLPLFSLACNYNNDNSSSLIHNDSTHFTNPYKHISSIHLPDGYQREKADSGSFTYFLRGIELKKSKTVYLYNGEAKQNQSAQYAILNISVGTRDLQQCADAAMRLRAEYLFEKKLFERIVFYDNANTAYKFSVPYTKGHFMDFMNRVFGMCGTASLSKQLNAVSDFSTIQPGDIIIRGGFPGHAVIVMDVAVNLKGEKIYLLAQSYMPAQDIHVLKNLVDKEFSPWYKVNAGDIIQTPEYSFTKNELKRW